MEISEAYRNVILTARPQKTEKGRWSVAVGIQSDRPGSIPEIFYAENGITYILEEEAAKKSLNLGRNLINKNRI